MPARITTLLIVMMLFSLPALAEVLLPHAGQVNLDPHRQVLLDSSGNFSPSDNHAPHAFVAQGSKGLGYVKGPVWMRYTVTRPARAPATWWLELQSPLVDHATLYFPRGDGSYRMAHSGDHAPTADREVQYRSPVFKLELPPDNPITFYVRVEGRNTMSFRTILWTPEAFFEDVHLETLFFGLFSSTLLLTALSSLWLLRSTRNRSYALLAIYTALVFVSTVCLQGYGYLYLWPDQPGLNESLLIISWMLLPLAMATFNLSFIGALHPPRQPALNWFLAGTAAFAIVSIALSLSTGPAWVRLANSVWNLAATGIICILLAWYALRGNQNARGLFYAMLVLTVCVAARTLRNLGLLDAGTFTDNAYQVGLMAHVLVVQYAISRHYRTLRDEKDLAQAEVLRLTQISEQELNIRVQSQTKALSETLLRLEQALEKERLLQKRKQLFLDTLSHELRTPLTIIDLSAQNLAMNQLLHDEEKMARYQKILDATSRIHATMEHHFDLAEVTNQDDKAESIVCSLKELISNTVSASDIFADHHTIQVECDDLPEKIPFDQEALNLALRCLLDNALKYSPPGTTVTLRGYRLGNRKEDGICLEVLDEGHGIPADDLQKLFTPYFRCEATKHIPGTGLGLANAKQLLAAKGGELSVDSTPGRGCCFRITLYP